eukprot:s217_g8.t1
MAIAVHVNCHDQSLQFDAALSWTVADVKVKIAEFTAIPPQQQRLVLPEGTILTTIFHHQASLNDKEVLSSIRAPGVDVLHIQLAALSTFQREWIDRVAGRPMVLRDAPDAIRGDRAVVSAAVRAAGEALQFASPTLRGDRATVRQAVQQMGGAFIYASAELRSDRDFVLEMLAVNPGSMQGASADLLKDPDFVLAAIRSNPWALALAPTEMQKDRDFLLKVVVTRGDALYIIPAEFCDKEIVLAAVKQCGDALELLPEDSPLLEDRHVIHAAVTQGSADIPKAWGGDRELLLLAIQRDGLLLERGSAALKDDPEVVLTAVQQNGNAFKSASNRLRSKRNFIFEAAKISADVVKHVSPLHRTDATFVALLQRIASGQEVSEEEASKICEGRHEDQLLKSYLLSEIRTSQTAKESTVKDTGDVP